MYHKNMYIQFFTIISVCTKNFEHYKSILIQIINKHIDDHMNTSNSTIVVQINNKSLNMKLANEFNISISILHLAKKVRQLLDSCCN